MKDFSEFRKTLNQETVDEWSREILERIEPQLAGLDSVEQLVKRSDSFHFQLAMRLLEAYHDWLGQNG